MAESNWERLIKQRIGGYKEEPSDDLWSGIATSVNHRNVIARAKKWLIIETTASIFVFAAVTVALLTGTPRVPQHAQGALTEEWIEGGGAQTGSSGERSDQSLGSRAVPVDSIRQELLKGDNRSTNLIPSQSGPDLLSNDQDDYNQNEVDSIVSDQNLSSETHIQQAFAPGYLLHLPIPSMDFTLPDRMLKKVALTKGELLRETEGKTKGSKDKVKKRSVYLLLMPTLAYNRVEVNQQDNQLITDIDELSAFSPKRMGIRAEAGVNWHLSKKVSLFTGMVYFQRNQTIGYTLESFDSLRLETTSRGGLSASYEPVHRQEQRSFEHNLKNIGLQVGIDYRLGSRIFDQSVGAGIELHKGLNKPNETNRESGFDEDPNFYSFYNVYYMLRYPRDKDFQFLLQPSFNYSFYLDRDIQAPFYVKPYGFGLNFGFTYKF